MKVRPRPPMRAIPRPLLEVFALSAMFGTPGRRAISSAFRAASDHLSTHISYACTIATDFTRQGLLDAMKARHSYGATDNIVLDYRASSGGKEYLQGDAFTASGDVTLNVKNPRHGRPIRQIDVIKNNTFVTHAAAAGARCELPVSATSRLPRAKAITMFE